MYEEHETNGIYMLYVIYVTNSKMKGISLTTFNHQILVKITISKISNFHLYRKNLFGENKNKHVAYVNLI